MKARVRLRTPKANVPICQPNNIQVRSPSRLVSRRRSFSLASIWSLFSPSRVHCSRSRAIEVVFRKSNNLFTAQRIPNRIEAKSRMRPNVKRHLTGGDRRSRSSFSDVSENPSAATAKVSTKLTTYPSCVIVTVCHLTKLSLCVVDLFSSPLVVVPSEDGCFVTAGCYQSKGQSSKLTIPRSRRAIV